MMQKKPSHFPKKPRPARKPLVRSPENRPAQLNFPQDLPITARKDAIIKAIQTSRVVIISGETGSGKTTQIPKCCLAAGCGTRGMIGCTQPRRIAAINVAKRMAFEFKESLGQSVGYKIRFDDKTPAGACIKVMTDGILLAETQQDPLLKRYDTIIVDEAHERSLNIDFTLGILRRLIKKRKHLKLIITSATIDTRKFSEAFDNAPIIEVSGRMFPVEMIYRPILEDTGEKQNPEDQGYVEAAADAAHSLLTRTRSGDMLIFMPTEQDIGETMELLRGRQHPGVTILPLFARLSAGEQAKVFSRAPGRKIIVSTNVAETSLTIPGIRYVIDTGLARIPSYSPRTRTTSLPVRPISQSSANQRMGRCGRVENGICIRLYDEDDFNGRPFFTAPEILRSNLAEVILRMISLKLGDVQGFPFIDPPAPKSIRDGFDTLVELGAVKVSDKPKKSFELTDVGQIMSRIPVDPKLSRILIAAKDNHCLAEALVIATALSISDVRQRPADKAAAADQKHARFKDPSSDFITLLNIWDAYQAEEKKSRSRTKLRQFCMDHFLSFKRIREWLDIHSQIRRQLKEHGFSNFSPFTFLPGTDHLKSKAKDIGGPLYIALHKSLLAGYLSHIAHKKEKNIYAAAKGQQAMIFPGSGLFDKAGPWIVAAEYVKTSQLFARGVANIDPAWLEEIGKDLCTRTYSDPRWEKKQGRVMATEQVSLFGLIIVAGRAVPYGKINPQEAGDIFIRRALVDGEIHQPFAFMVHNRNLIQELEEAEHKTRQRDILVSTEDMVQFYHARLPRPFYHIKTFARFLKDQKEDAFLRMTRQDLEKNKADQDHLALFPDVLNTAQGNFALSYRFDPGNDTDGVTVKVPADMAAQVPKTAVEKLVPGLFEEKIAGLIKGLPKSYRVRLMPVQATAARIANNLPKDDTPLFSQLSAFIRKHYGLTIPATAWSEDHLADHLKMRISIRDHKDREITSLRDPSILNRFPHAAPQPGTSALDRARQTFEKTGITDWTFPDLAEVHCIDEPDGFTRKVYPGLKIEEDTLSLRLFLSRQDAKAAHVQGIRRLYEHGFTDLFKAVKKDIRATGDLKRIARYFDGPAAFQHAVYTCITRHLFEKNLRTREAFESYIQKLRPTLFQQTQDLIQDIQAVGLAYAECFSLIQALSLKHQARPQASRMLADLFEGLKNLVPPHFLSLYSIQRIQHLPRYVDCLRIRAQRGADNPAKESEKAKKISRFEHHLATQVAGLSEKTSPEKAEKVEDFFWLLEEYKISVFAQELKTAVKVSAKRLEKELHTLSTLI
ncbi:ATP-dependent RNA helicase HrpA [Desulfotignum balticum]|uniref:ATP-dependent RNA helicase HrpA n=1 Tax=Desulfotignum balticum TaxID=115781 RepID=UPI001FDEFF4F|nr:ATP-dependent RNA helicase HrpA [Desulfotignum balticum]